MKGRRVRIKRGVSPSLTQLPVAGREVKASPATHRPSEEVRRFYVHNMDGSVHQIEERIEVSFTPSSPRPVGPPNQVMVDRSLAEQWRSREGRIAFWHANHDLRAGTFKEFRKRARQTIGLVLALVVAAVWLMAQASSLKLF